MKVCILTLGYPPNCGGSGYYAYELAEALVEYGHDVTVYSYKKQAKNKAGIHHKQVGSRSPHILFYNLALRKLEGTIIDSRFDIILCNEIAGSMLSNRFFSTQKVLMAMHHQSDQEYTVSMWRKVKLAMVQRLQNLMIHKSTGITFLTRGVMNNTIDRYSLSKKTFVLPCIVPPISDIGHKTSSRNGSLTILYPSGAGDNFERKGILDFLSTYKELAERTKAKMTLNITGGNPVSISEIQKTAQSLGIQEDLNFSKNLTFGEVLQMYENADIVVFTSLYEGFGRPFIEALQFGKPIIATPVGIAPEVIVNGKNGYICNSQSEVLMHLDRLVSDQDLRKSVAKNSKKTDLSRFSKKEIVKSFENIVKELG